MDCEAKLKSIQEITENMANLIGGKVVLSLNRHRPMVVKRWKGVSYSVMYLSDGLWRIGKRQHGQETLYNSCSESMVKDVFDGIVAKKGISLSVYRIQ